MNNNIFDEEIVIPEELNIDRIRKTVTKRAAKHKAYVYTRNAGIVLAASFAAFLLTAKFSPKVAAIAADLPLIGHFFDDITLNKGYIDALNNDYAVDVHEIKKTEDFDLELAYVMADQQNILLFFDIDYKNDEIKSHSLSIEPKSIIDKNTEKEIERDSATLPALSDDKEYAVATVSIGGKEYSSELTVNIDVHDFTTDKSTSLSYDVSLPELPSPKEYNLNRTYVAKGQSFTVEKITLYPTTALVDVKYDKNNSMLVKSIDFILKNNTGDSWKNSCSGVNTYYKEDSARYVIDGGYYSSTDELSLEVGNISLLPKDKEIVTYNFTTNTFTDETGTLDLLDSYNEDGIVYFRLKTGEQAQFFSCFYDADGETDFNYSIGLSENYSTIKPAILEGGIAKFIRSYPEFVESINESIELK